MRIGKDYESMKRFRKLFYPTAQERQELQECFENYSRRVAGSTDPAGENAGSASSQRNRDDSEESPIETRR